MFGALGFSLGVQVSGLGVWEVWKSSDARIAGQPEFSSSRPNPLSP